MQAAQQLVTVLGGMKSAAMKLGQMLSVLDLDLLPEQQRELFRGKLAELRDRAPFFPFPAMRGVIEDDLGPMSRIFDDFDETPIAAASIGQVYRAQLRDGRRVAVKVKYPDVDRAVESGMRNLDDDQPAVESVAAQRGRRRGPRRNRRSIGCELERDVIRAACEDRAEDIYDFWVERASSSRRRREPAGVPRVHPRGRPAGIWSTKP